jgi:hypothetical protein
MAVSTKNLLQAILKAISDAGEPTIPARPHGIEHGSGPENLSRFGLGDVTSSVDDTVRSKTFLEGITKRKRVYDPEQAHALGFPGDVVGGKTEVVVPGIEPRMRELLRAAENPDSDLHGLPREELEKVAEELYNAARAARTKEFTPKVERIVKPEKVTKEIPAGSRLDEKGRKITSRGNPESYERSPDIIHGEVGVSDINKGVYTLDELLPYGRRPQGKKPIPVKEDPTILGKPETVKRVPEGKAEDTLDATKDFLRGDQKSIDFLGTSTQKEKDRIMEVLESRGIDTSNLDKLSPANIRKLEASARRFGTEFDENSFIQDIFTPFNKLWDDLQKSGKLPWRQQGSAGSILSTR